MKNLRPIAFVIALLTVCVWAETFVSSKVLLSHGLRPADIFVLRFSIAYAGMWLLSYRRFLCSNWKDELLTLLLGITGGSLYFLTENSALSFSTASNVAIILSATPLATAILMAIFYKSERMKLRQVFGSIVAIVGLALIIFNGEVVLKLNPKGDMLALGAVICWGFYSLIIRKVSKGYDTAFITRKVFGYGLLTIIPYFFLNGWPPLNASVLGLTVVWGNILYLGLVASLACFLAWNWALSVVGTVKTTNLLYLQPFIAMSFGHLILGDKITWMAILGAVILIGGMYWLSTD